MQSSADNSVFQFDLAVYPIEVIKKAAYKFAGEFDVQIELIEGGRVAVSLSPKKTIAAFTLDAQRLPNEVLDQDLREVVAKETEGVRNLLLAQAFSSLSLVDPHGDTAEYGEDPLEIGAATASESPTARASELRAPDRDQIDT